MSGRLEGRRAIITGGASGIGLATAERFVAEGASVALVDARNGAAEAAAATLTAAGARAVGYTCDVRDEPSVRDVLGRAAAQFGGLDSIVAAAGIARAADTHELSLAEWEAVIGVNLTGVFLTVKHGLHHLLAGGGGAIVTIGSVASLVAAGTASAYDASKGGVLQLTRAVAVEYAERGIRANCVCPGLIATDLAANTASLHGAASTPAAQVHPPPLARMSIPQSRRADPSEVAAAVAFLCSDDASFITGAALPVDGGYTAI